MERAASVVTPRILHPDRASRRLVGLVYGDWPALAILLVLPAGALIHRIFVEEAVLTEVMGRAYTDYAARTKRLVPGLW